MLENYEHYITKNIRAFYRKRLFSPIIFLIILIALWLISPMKQMLIPYNFSEKDSLDQVFDNGERYCKVNLINLHFTGYTKDYHNRTTGYFYYGQGEQGCYIVLLSPNVCDEGLPTIDSITISAKLVKGGTTLDTLYAKMAEDLEWSLDGITKELPSVYLSDPGYNDFLTGFMFVVYFVLMAYSIISIILYLIYICFPFLSPSITNMIVYGNPRKILEEAEEELATLPQLATEDMFITEHYFIMSSPYGNAIVPIKEILWLYKYSTLHKVLWYHFSISYTLHISANKHVFIHSPKNAKSDIDGIIDYLAEANHNILVGFSEKNRLKVQAVQGKALHLEILHAIFKGKRA